MAKQGMTSPGNDHASSQNQGSPVPGSRGEKAERMDSIWSQTVEFPQFPPMDGDHKTDVLVIGGGIAGVLCAYSLQQAGVETILVEAERICSGTTCNTTAKITSQHGLVYHKIARRYGDRRAALYLEANERALSRYERLCRDIDCDFVRKPNYVYSLDDPAVLEQELETLRRIGYDAALETELPLPFPVAGAVRFDRQAQFHPLKFLKGLVPVLTIFERTKVQALKEGIVVTDRGTITAQKVIVATHYPMFNQHGAFFLKLYQHRSYVLALEHGPKLDGMYVDDQARGLSFRTHGNFLLLGGGSHRTGRKGGGWAELTQIANRYVSLGKEAARWATQDCMSLDGIPYIGQYARSTPDLYVATGFNKWGMSSAMAAAELLTDLILGKPNLYAELYSPSRTILHGRLLSHAGETMYQFLKPTVPRCPHMGCALEYNPQEHSWDCPCHGSRFTKGGEVIDNPARDGMDA